MYIFLILFALGMIGYAIYAVVIPYRARYKRDENEIGKAPIFERMCLAQFGIEGAVYVRLSVYESFLVICYRRPYFLPFNEIRYIHRSFLLWHEKIEIEHQSKILPQNIQLAFEDTDIFQKIMTNYGLWRKTP